MSASSVPGNITRRRPQPGRHSTWSAWRTSGCSQTNRRPPAVPITRRALVLGGGPAGLQTAKDLAAAGIDVTLVERSPWLGGRLCRLNRVFQSEGWPSVCDSSCVGPVQAKGVVLGEQIQALTQTRVMSAERSNGCFKVSLRSDPEFVNPDLCISCDK